MLSSCNKLKDNPDLVGTWGASQSIQDGHTLVISDDGTGHPYESPCFGMGDLNVKLKKNVLKFNKNMSTRKEYIVSLFPTVATEIIPFQTQISCVPVEYVSDTIFPGETYMILDESLYLKKHQ